MASGPVSDAVLLDHSQYFDRMLSLIPARLYFPKDAAADEEFAMRKKGFLKVSTEKSSKLAKKEARSQALKEKLNPENFKTVPEIQRQAAQAGASDVSDAKSEESKAEEDESVADQTEKSAEPPRPITAPAQSMEELRVRVQQRIEEMRKKRNAEAHEGSDEKLKRREERKRKRDEKRKARKLAAGDTPKKTEDGAASAPAAADAAELESQEEADASSSDQDIDDIKFGTFDFSAHKPVPSYLSKKKGKMSLQQTLKRVEGEREQMKALEGTEEGQKLKEDMLWDKALKRAKGEKLKDDPKRIKAAIKREHKKKVKSAVEWKERNAAVAKQQAERQEKRQSNIDNKIQKRKDKKMGNKKKSSGGRAGFEGKKRSFLNK